MRIIHYCIYNIIFRKRIEASNNTNLSLKSLMKATEADCKNKINEMKTQLDNKEKEYNDLMKENKNISNLLAVLIIY